MREGVYTLAISDQIRIMNSLLDKIKTDVHRQYEKLPNKTKDIINAYEPLFEMINAWTESRELTVFSTNYDCVIEEFCSAQSRVYFD